MKRIELLAPAGDLERLKVNLLYGADAVYFGGQEYSLRANANNFSIEEMKEAASFAHRLGKKVYLTFNIVFHNEDTEGYTDYLDQAVKAGIDAFIVSDPFVIQYLRQHYPDVEVHLSTQNSTSNAKAVQFFKEEGVSRVVLARELSKDQIKHIIDETGMEIEVFIHGAMCTCYSGRCTLSNYVTNRDSNRGGCSQVCRFAFDVDFETEKFTMATKDLNLAHYMQDLIEIGVASLKIEGRMRSLYYLATVVGSYRKLIDAYYENRLTEELVFEQEQILNRVANRETSAHYFDKVASWADQYYTGRQELSNQDYLAMVTSYDPKEKIVTIIERNYFKPGDIAEFITPSGKTIVYPITHIYDEEMMELECARHPEQVLKLYLEEEVEPYSMMRIQTRKEEKSVC